jgi:hypothetical protein
MDDERTFFQAIVLNELTCIISDECNEVILNVLLTICLLALALGGKCGMSGLEFIIIL